MALNLPKARDLDSLCCCTQRKQKRTHLAPPSAPHRQLLLNVCTENTVGNRQPHVFTKVHQLEVSVEEPVSRNTTAFHLIGVGTGGQGYGLTTLLSRWLAFFGDNKTDVLF